MIKSNIPRICVVGNGAGVGKSLVVTGLLMALRRRGLSVSLCVMGANLQQAVVYSRLSRRYVRCIDPTVLEPQEMLDAIGQAGVGADLVLIDGHGGLYDGVAIGDLTGSDAYGAVHTSTPCITVLDVPCVSQTLAAVVAGLVRFTGAPAIRGVVLNGLEGGRDGARMARTESDALMERFELPQCVGCIPFEDLSEHLPVSGVVERENQTALSLTYLDSIEQLVERHVSIDTILSLASIARPFEYRAVEAVVPRGQCRIAVANDSCFGVCFQDNLDLLRFCGADLLNFSPLADSSLPSSIGGVYIPGGCIHEYAASLAANESMLRSLQAFVHSGGVLFSEGAGTALLCREFEVASGGVYSGAGIIPLNVTSHARKSVTCSAVTLEDSVFGPGGARVSCLTSSEWGRKKNHTGESDREESSLVKMLRFEESHSAHELEGFSVSAQSCSTFHFLHFGSNPDFTRAFVLAAAAHQSTVKKT
jgi:cobyrinic acid a,c-diamide synthase